MGLGWLQQLELYSPIAKEATQLEATPLEAQLDATQLEATQLAEAADNLCDGRQPDSEDEVEKEEEEGAAKRARTAWSLPNESMGGSCFNCGARQENCASPTCYKCGTHQDVEDESEEEEDEDEENEEATGEGDEEARARATAHGNGKGKACDGKGPRRTETAHGKGEPDDGKGQRRKGKAYDCKGHGERKAVDEEALVAVEKAGLQGQSARR